MATVATTPTPQSSQGTSPQPAPPPSHGESLLKRAQDANVMPQQVTINGKLYYVVVEVGGNIQNTPLNQADAEKLQHLAKDFFDSHQEHFQRAHPQQNGQAAPSLNHRDIDYIDERGIHFKDSTRQIQGNVETALPPERGAFLLQELELNQRILNGYYESIKNMHPHVNIPKKDIPHFIKSFLPEHLKNSRYYSPDQVMEAVKAFAKDNVKRIGLDIFKWNNKERDIDTFNAMIDNIFSDSSRSFQDNLTLANDHLKNHMTAQTVWKVMMQILFPPTMTLIPINTNAPTNNTRNTDEDPSSDDDKSSSRSDSDSDQKTKKRGSDSDSDWGLSKSIKPKRRPKSSTSKSEGSDSEYDSTKVGVKERRARSRKRAKPKNQPKEPSEQDNLSNSGDITIFIPTSDTNELEQWKSYASGQGGSLTDSEGMEMRALGDNPMFYSFNGPPYDDL